MSRKKILSVLLTVAILAAIPAIGYPRSRSIANASHMVTSSCEFRAAEQIFSITALYDIEEKTGKLTIYSYYHTFLGSRPRIDRISLKTFTEKYIPPPAQILCIIMTTTPNGASGFEIFYTK